MTLEFPFSWPAGAQPPDELSTLRQQPVVRAVLPSGDPVWLMTRYADIRATLSDRRLSRNRERPGAPRMTAEEGIKMFQNPKIDRDPPEHTRMRRLMAKAFTPARVERLRPYIEEVTADLLDSDRWRTPPVDLVAEFSVPLTLRIICRLLGVPVHDQDRFRNGLGGAWQYIGELIETKRVAPEDDLISELIRVHDEEDGRLSTHELHVWCVVLLMAGYETTTAQLGSGIVLLLQHPDQLDMVRSDPSLIPNAVEETLRCQVAGHSLSMLRYITEDIEISGVTVPAGSGLIPVLESANFDESVFPDPMRFDITRDAKDQITFSAGPHYCLGAALARLELQIAFGALLERFPNLRLAVDVAELRHHDNPLELGFVEVPVTV